MNKKIRLAPFLILLLISGCTKPDDEVDQSDLENFNIPDEVGLVLGKELEDPYAIHNISKAYSSLKLSGEEIPALDLKPNHLYLRFLPKNNEEWELLKKDTSLILYDYPLNFEITKPGDFYHDSTLPDSSFMWQYCVVPGDMSLPAIHYEVIYEVFIPPDVDNSSKNSSGEMDRFYEDLISESARLTGNLDKDDKSEIMAKGLFTSKWTPKGTIRVWDDLLGRFIPLGQVSVHARWFTRIETDLTDENGYFQTGKFRYDVHYSIKWERAHYSIRNGMFLQAWYNGPKKRGDWNLDIKGGESVMYATIHRAACKFFYGDNLGITRPTLRDGSKTKICYRNGNGKGIFWGDWSASGIMPDIQIWGKSKGSYKLTNKIFGNTTHELSHQAHSQYLGNIRFWKVPRIIQESWADAVEWALSNDEYHKLGRKYGDHNSINYNHYFNNHNKWPYVGDKDYSPIFIDLMDTINQRIVLGHTYPNDLISGYPLSYIHNNLLVNSIDINSLRVEVKKHKLNEVTDFQVEELFDLY